MANTCYFLYKNKNKKSCEKYGSTQPDPTRNLNPFLTRLKWSILTRNPFNLITRLTRPELEPAHPTPPILPWLPARIKQEKKKKSTTWKAKLGCSIYTQKKKRHNKIVKADETVNALTCKSEVRSKIQNTEPLKSHRWVLHWVELYAIPLCQPIIWFPFPPTTTTGILNHSLFHHNLHSILISKSNPYFLYSTFEIHLHLNSKAFISSSTPICLKYLTTCPSQQKRQQEKRKKKKQIIHLLP